MYIVFGGHVHFHKYLLQTFNLKRNIGMSILMRVPLSHPFNIVLYARMLTIMVAGIRGFLMCVFLELSLKSLSSMKWHLVMGFCDSHYYGFQCSFKNFEFQEETASLSA